MDYPFPEGRSESYVITFESVRTKNRPHKWPVFYSSLFWNEEWTQIIAPILQAKKEGNLAWGSRKEMCVAGSRDDCDHGVGSVVACRATKKAKKKGTQFL